jgi:hypothetical protein
VTSLERAYYSLLGQKKLAKQVGRSTCHLKWLHIMHKYHTNQKQIRKLPQICTSLSDLNFNTPNTQRVLMQRQISKADSTMTWGLASTPINNMIGEKSLTDLVLVWCPCHAWK